MDENLRPRQLAGGWGFAEGPRWRDGRLVLSDTLGGRVITVAEDGEVQTLCEVPHPMGIDWLPDGTLLAVSMTDFCVYAFDGSQVSLYCDLRRYCPGPTNDIVADRFGRAYVGNMGTAGFLDNEPPKPADLVLIGADRRVTPVAGDLLFANGMVLCDGGRRLLVAETFGHRITSFVVDPDDGSLHDRAVFADLGERTPDGIALDAEGYLWVASMETCEFLRVGEGGEITHRIDPSGRNAVACALGGPRLSTLYLVTLQPAEGVTDPTEGIRRGDSIARVEVCEAPVPGAVRGW